MAFIKSYLFLLAIPLFAFISVHKYYVSVTEINYVKEEASVQIISRIFIDDFENLLRKRYDEKLTLSNLNEPEIVETYIKDYLNQKIKIKINDTNVSFDFIGKEYDNDIMLCYLEIKHVKAINSFEITNQILFDSFKEQQNIVKTSINSKQKSFLLTQQKNKALLNFN